MRKKIEIPVPPPTLYDRVCAVVFEHEQRAMAKRFKEFHEWRTF